MGWGEVSAQGLLLDPHSGVTSSNARHPTGDWPVPRQQLTCCTMSPALLCHVCEGTGIKGISYPQEVL